jgi:hypothetical protein
VSGRDVDPVGGEGVPPLPPPLPVGGFPGTLHFPEAVVEILDDDGDGSDRPKKRWWRRGGGDDDTDA